ncbi:MAG TPA: aminodeoxychorismate lyase, partial [Chromatiales bacterium]|nr:aminodeoxychorismate lyase [Chromatiales bacterium]
QRRAVIKIILTSGSGGRGYARPDPVRPSRIVMRYPWPDYPADHWRRGVRVHHCRTTLACHPDLAAVKHLNRLEQVLARQEWQGGDSAEGLMRERAGNVIEGTMSNLFLVQNGVLHTPDLKDCGVHGIARRRILALATEAGIETAMGDYTPADLLAADELMLSNSLIGLWPVREYLNQPFGPGPVYRRLLAELLRNYPVINA